MHEVSCFTENVFPGKIKHLICTEPLKRGCYFSSQVLHGQTTFQRPFTPDFNESKIFQLNSQQ